MAPPRRVRRPQRRTPGRPGAGPVRPAEAAAAGSEGRTCGRAQEGPRSAERIHPGTARRAGSAESVTRAGRGGARGGACARGPAPPVGREEQRSASRPGGTGYEEAAARPQEQPGQSPPEIV